MEETKCSLNIKNLVGKWKSSFPSNTQEYYYSCEVPICTYEIILYIIKDFIPEMRNLTKIELKKELIIIYLILKHSSILYFK